MKRRSFTVYYRYTISKIYCYILLSFTEGYNVLYVQLSLTIHYTIYIHKKLYLKGINNYYALAIYMSAFISYFLDTINIISTLLINYVKTKQLCSLN